MYQKFYYKTSEKPLQGDHAKANKLLQNLQRKYAESMQTQL